MTKFVCVSDDDKSEAVELPLEADNTLSLATVTSQFPGASGLKYRNSETGLMRAVSLSDNCFRPPCPINGWTKTGTLFCVFPKAENKRKMDELSDEESETKTKRVQKCSDLIVLGLPWRTTEEELRDYFSQFGELLMAQVKKHNDTGNSKGFGFVRFADMDVQKKVIAKRHNIGGRWCDVRIPLSRGETYGSEYNRKIFVGRLSEDITVEDLREYFSKFGEITDIFIPRPFRAFAFVTYESDMDASVCADDHIVKGVSLHVSNAMPKGGEPYGGSRMNSYQEPPPVPPVSSHYPNYSSQMKPNHVGGMAPMNHHGSRGYSQPTYYPYASRRPTNYGPMSR